MAKTPKIKRRQFLAGVAAAPAIGLASAAQAAEAARPSVPTVSPLAAETAPVSPDGTLLTVNRAGSDFMVDCLKAQTAEWDKRMTIAYEKAMKEASSQQHDQLRAAQRLWIQYRDANCLYYGMGEGTIARIDAGECMRSMTEARARELEGLGHQ